MSERSKTNHGWIHVFVFIGVASVAAAGIMIWYNLSIQLKQEQLDAARQLWQARGPKDYDMTYTRRLNEETRLDTIKVKVRDGKVRDVLLNGKPLEASPEAAPDDDPRVYHSM